MSDVLINLGFLLLFVGGFLAAVWYALEWFGMLGLPLLGLAILVPLFIRDCAKGKV